MQWKDGWMIPLHQCAHVFKCLRNPLQHPWRSLHAGCCDPCEWRLHACYEPKLHHVSFLPSSWGRIWGEDPWSTNSPHRVRERPTHHRAAWVSPKTSLPRIAWIYRKTAQWKRDSVFSFLHFCENSTASPSMTRFPNLLHTYLSDGIYFLYCTQLWPRSKYLIKIIRDYIRGIW